MMCGRLAELGKQISLDDLREIDVSTRLTRSFMRPRGMRMAYGSGSGTQAHQRHGNLAEAPDRVAAWNSNNKM